MEKKTINEIISIIKSIKRKKEHVFTSCTQWDIYSKTYSSLEYAARLMRKKGFDITIRISDNMRNPSYFMGYVVFNRYCYVEIK